MNESPYTGGCACGAIRYAISDTPLVRGHAWDYLDPALAKFEKMPAA